MSAATTDLDTDTDPQPQARPPKITHWFGNGDSYKETDAEQDRRIARNRETMAQFTTKARDFLLPPHTFEALLDEAQMFLVSDEDTALPTTQTALLAVRALAATTPPPPLRRCDTRRFAFDGARWTQDRAETLAAAWIAQACDALADQTYLTPRGEDRQPPQPTDPLTIKEQGWPEALRMQFCRWAGSPELAVQRLYAVLPDEGRDALWEDTAAMLNTAAGVVNLRDGSLRPAGAGAGAGAGAEAGDYTRLAVAPAPEASDLWLRFLEQQVPDPEVRDWLQRAVGYIATGLFREDFSLWLLGKTRSGKSTFTSALHAALGSYVWKDDTTAILRTQTRQLTVSDRYRGIRLWRMAEMEPKYHIARARLKDLTGGDKLPGCNWRPQFTILVESNFMPSMPPDESGATEERLRVVRFDVRRRAGQHVDPAVRMDTSVRERLQTTEAPGVLRWIIEGAVRYFAEGLDEVPDGITSATRAVMAAQDPVGTFYARLAPSTEPVLFGTLHDQLSVLCQAAGKPTPGRNPVAAQMRAEGYTVKPAGKNKLYAWARLGDGTDEDEGKGAEGGAG